jgi:hypothetical protein
MGTIKVTRTYVDRQSTFEVNSMDELREVIAEDKRSNPRDCVYSVVTVVDALRLGAFQGITSPFLGGPWFCGEPEVFAVLWIDREVTS